MVVDAKRMHTFQFMQCPKHYAAKGLKSQLQSKHCACVKVAQSHQRHPYKLSDHMHQGTINKC